MNLFTSKEAGAVLRLTPGTLIRYAKTGKIPSAVVGRRYLFAAEDLDAFIASKRRVQ